MRLMQGDRTIKKAIEILKPLVEASERERSDHHYVYCHYVYCNDQFDDILDAILSCYENEPSRYDLCEDCAEKLVDALRALVSPSIYTSLPGYSWRDEFMHYMSIDYGRDGYIPYATHCGVCGIFGEEKQEFNHFLRECPDWELDPDNAYAIDAVHYDPDEEFADNALTLARLVIAKDLASATGKAEKEGSTPCQD